MKHIRVHSIALQDNAMSDGLGFDEQGKAIEFIGFTGTMRNILEALEDYKDNPETWPPYIYLEGWQWQDIESNKTVNEGEDND